jgi:formylglycine-generating enzyme required for sulfatase activity
MTVVQARAVTVEGQASTADRKHVDKHVEMPSIEMGASEARIVPSTTSSGSLFKTLRIPIVIAAVILGALLVIWAVQKGKTPENVPSGGTSPQDSSFQGMVLIEGGEFTMGRNDGNVVNGVNSRARHIRRRSNRSISTSTKSQTASTRSSSTPRAILHSPLDEQRLVRTEDAEVPVTFVSWSDANNYATWRASSSD